jgi:hypothetical protein
MTTEKYPGLNTVILPVGAPESRHMLWRKAILAWTYVYATYHNEADWFLRADDDVSFLILWFV